MNTHQIRVLLKNRFCAPEWIFMEEVAPRTGGGTTYADGVAFNLWNNRGHAIYGFEIKVTRSDWLKELKQPHKAESVFDYCDKWFLVAPSSILKEGELPLNWGFIEAKETGLCTKVQAPKLEPKPINKAFFASLMRRGQESMSMDIDIKVRQSIETDRVNYFQRIQDEVANRTKYHDDLLKNVKKLEEETGISINSFRCPIELVKMAQKLQKLKEYEDDKKQFSKLINLADQLNDASNIIKEALELVK